MKRAELDVYIEAKCRSCRRAVALAQEIDAEYARMSVRVIDLSESKAPSDDVFAVPTFVLNGKTVSLGNPDGSELRRQIDSLLADG